jgi:putative phage-type endonuclease
MSNAREQWLANRRKGIGGSDAAAILQLSPGRTPMDIWLDKTGRTEPERFVDEDRDFLLALGNELEAGIARLYTRKTGRDLEQIPPGAVLFHRSYPVLIGTPDRLVVGESRGVEIKTENSFQNKFGAPGDPGAVPLHYEIQCRHYMAITDRDVWDVPVLKGAAKLDIHTIERDRELEDMMIEQLLAWWESHIVDDVPPPVDGSDAWRSHLATKFPRNILPVVAAGSKAEVLAIQLARTKRHIDRFEEHKQKLENQVKALIGEHDGLQGIFGKVTWKKTKDSSETDFEAAFEHARDCVLKSAESEGRPELLKELDDLFTSIRAQFTRTKPGVRRFLLTLDKKVNLDELAQTSEGGTVVDSTASVSA